MSHLCKLAAFYVAGLALLSAAAVVLLATWRSIEPLGVLFSGLGLLLLAVELAAGLVADLRE